MSDLSPDAAVAAMHELVAGVELDRVAELKAALTEGEVDRLNLERRLGEASLVMVQEPGGAVHIRPGLGETLHRVDTDFLVFVGDDPDSAKVQIDADGIDDAAGFLSVIPGAAIAIRDVYAGEWAVNRPRVDAQLADINARVAADKRVLDAAGKLADAVTAFLADGTEIIMHPDLWGPLSELMNATTYDGMPEPCQPIGCDNGYHLHGCTFAAVDGNDAVDARRALNEVVITRPEGEAMA